MISGLIKILPSFDVISFDVFDTLLLRPYLKPTDLWRDLERRIKAPGFAAERYQADRAAYAEVRGREGEPTLDAKYCNMSLAMRREFGVKIGNIHRPQVALQSKVARVVTESVMARGWARQISRRFGRTTGARTCPAASDCIIRTVSFGPDPLKTRC